MQHRTIISIILVLLLCTVGTAQTISTQGVLRDGDGHAVEDGDYTMIFNIYDAESGGSRLWGPESQTVEIVNGIYAVVLGETAPITSLNSDGANWVEIEVNGELLTPRLRLNVSPYELSEMSGSSNTFPGAGNAGIGTTSPESKLTLVQPGDNADLLQFDENNDGLKEFTFTGMFAGGGAGGNKLKLKSQWMDNIMFWRGDGNVGLGTDAPGAKLTVEDGSIYVDNNDFGGTPSVDVAIGDTDTGLKSAGDGELDIYSNNSRTMSVRAGKVGIGTNLPGFRLHVEGGSDVEVNGGGYMVLGPTAGGNLAMDTNEIMARDGGATSTLYLNNDGGDVQVGGTAKFEADISSLTGGSWQKPFQFVKYTGSGENCTIATSWDADDWIAAVVGFDSGYGDIDEGGSQDMWQINCAIASNGNWEIFCDAPTHNNGPDWDVYVMFVSKQFGQMTTGYGQH